MHWSQSHYPQNKGMWHVMILWLALPVAAAGAWVLREVCCPPPRSFVDSLTLGPLPRDAAYLSATDIAAGVFF